MTDTLKNKQFKEGDWASLYDSKFNNFKGKFNTHWLGPYEIEKVFEMVFFGLKLLMMGMLPSW